MWCAGKLGRLYPVNGEPIFKAKCASCHEPAIERAPTREALKCALPEEIYDASHRRDEADGGDCRMPTLRRRPLLTGKSPVPNAFKPPDASPCAAQTPLAAQCRRGMAGATTSQPALSGQARPSARRMSKPQDQMGLRLSGTKNTER